MPRHISIFTGSRSEYGLYAPVLRAIHNDARFRYSLIVAGSHWKEGYGDTVGEIQRDGFRISHELKIELPNNTLADTSLLIGQHVQKLSDLYRLIRPDLALVYGDRSEAFAAVIAATQMAIPTAHIEGGDYTEGGALDDSVRHAMTKLAHLHFTTNEDASSRVARLGEEGWRIFNVGLPALDGIYDHDYPGPVEVRQKLSLDPDRPVIVFTQHSVTTEYQQATAQIAPSLEALVTVAERHGSQIVVTYPNDDAGSAEIIQAIEALAARNLPGFQFHKSLGRRLYHGVLNIASACVGNSSSGIKETPVFGCPTVNIGTRQRGRLRAENVLDVGYSAAEIISALERCLLDRDWSAKARSCANPYWAGGAGQKIADVLATIPLDQTLLCKKMTF